MSAAPRELRILDGAHAGARVPVCAGLTIGCSLDSDVVLSDAGVAGVHVRLVWDEAQDQWHLATPEGNAPAGPRLALGDVASVGPVRLTVSAANDPWPSRIAAPGAPAAGPPPQAEADTSAPPRSGTPAQPPGRVRWAVCTALGGVALTSVIAVLLALGWPGPPAAAAAASRVPVAQQMSQAEAVLALQRTGPGVQVRPDAAGRALVVEGIVRDEAVQQALLAALSRLDPVPRIMVWSLPQLRDALRDAGTEVPAEIALQVSGLGELVIDGAPADPPAAAALAAAARRLLPPGIAVRCLAPGPQQVAERLMADLKSQGFALTGRIERGRLVLHGTMHDAELLRWEHWLVAFSRRHGGGLPFEMELRRDPPRRSALPSLPFVIASVIGAPQPYVVLGDGRRLLPGGEADGVRLVAVRADTVVFARDRQTFTRPR